ncbi:MAG: A/G-specific adenine glycosylase [Acidobacteria bacterium]|nr:A/G-specific adenine glycosylase [Acidobacteriota bacterium]MYE44542.1 A/G-specific adenine glycosylase [Acidobacteriota bacterium]
MSDLPPASPFRLLRRTLLAWFRKNKRQLPFRESPDAWRVWVSEVMLQQTRMEAVLPRYGAFVARFPDPGALADASEDEVLAAWAGLGYYGRARALHRAARQLAAEDRDIPGKAESLRGLPGIGEYTAAAIASIAFGEPVAAVDGNVRRVLSRLFMVGGVRGRAPFEGRVRDLAGRLMEADGARDPGDWNQALMELGATVCTPAVPRCGPCPVREFCWSRVAGRQTEFPERPARPRAVSVRLAVAVVRDREGRILVFRRGESPMRGLYELPCGEYRSDESADTALVREAASRYGIRLQPARALSGFRHTVMNRRIAVVPFEADLVDPAPSGIGPAGRFVHPRELDRIPSGSMLRKALQRVGSTSRAAGKPSERLLVSAPGDP